jgi:hypothetical protein
MAVVLLRAGPQTPHVSAPGRGRPLGPLVRSVLPYGAANGQAQSDLSHFDFWRVEAQRREAVTRFTRNKMNYLLEAHAWMPCLYPPGTASDNGVQSFEAMWTRDA